MPDPTATTDRPAARSTARGQLREELLGPPRPSGRARFSAVAFGLLLVATLVLPPVTDTAAAPGVALVGAGMMLLLGFAELLDPSMRRFVIAVRCGGLGMALLGFALQLISALG